jgi:hypothetical protein
MRRREPVTVVADDDKCSFLGKYAVAYYAQSWVVKLTKRSRLISTTTMYAHAHNGADNTSELVYAIVYMSVRQTRTPTLTHSCTHSHTHYAMYIIRR